MKFKVLPQCIASNGILCAGGHVGYVIVMKHTVPKMQEWNDLGVNLGVFYHYLLLPWKIPEEISRRSMLFHD